LVFKLFRRHSGAFRDYGYEDTCMLEAATQEDLDEVAEELGMKKGHRRLLFNAAADLRGGRGKGGGA